MHYVLWTLAIVVVVYLAQHFVWRWAARRWQLPCPTALSWMVDGRLADLVAGTEVTLDRMQLTPGMTVVEIGPGPGRLLRARRATRAARRTRDRRRAAAGHARQARPRNWRATILATSS